VNRVLQCNSNDLAHLACQTEECTEPQQGGEPAVGRGARQKGTLPHRARLSARPTVELSTIVRAVVTLRRPWGP
jgi:hypothetical protein